MLIVQMILSNCGKQKQSHQCGCLMPMHVELHLHLAGSY